MPIPDAPPVANARTSNFQYARGFDCHSTKLLIVPFLWARDLFGRVCERKVGSPEDTHSGHKGLEAFCQYI